LSIINIIGITTADISIKMSASTTVWIMPLSVIFKVILKIFNLEIIPNKNEGAGWFGVKEKYV